jgi:alpha-glucosidase (family GH31 glycosyl hydrolase)
MNSTIPATAVPVHRPRGVEHPYATSADQLVPPIPLAGAPLRIGAVRPGATAMTVEVMWADGGTETVEMQRSDSGAAQAIAMAGGDGHLGAAQAASLDTPDAWTCVLPALADRPGRYRFHADGAPTSDWFGLDPARWRPAGDRLVTGAGERLVPGSVEVLAGSGDPLRLRFALRLHAEDHVVGFGERFDAVDQRGRLLDSVVFEQYKSQGEHGRTYLPMPFAHVISTDGSGWGFHVRTDRRVWFDVGASDPQRLGIEVDLGFGTPQVDVATYSGSPTQVLGAFLDEVGRASELPSWVLRLWASGNEWNTQRIVQAQVQRHFEEDIPVGVVVVEAWSDEEGFVLWRDASYRPRTDGSVHVAADMSYQPDGAWPDPAGMIEDLHAKDVRLVLWQIPLLGSGEELGEETAAEVAVMRERCYAVQEADGSAYCNRGWWFPGALVPDFTNPEARRWWQDRHRWLVRELGVDGFKTDGGEHAWGADLRYADGRRGDEGNNRYPVEYAAAFGELMEQEGAAPITFSRAGYVGSQAHGLYWAGDENSTWDAFRHSLNAGITAASCGIVYWGWDIAGFSGPVPEAELYLRASAASAFLPVMQYHAEFNHHQRPLRDRTPWNIAEVCGDDRVVPVFRAYAKLRERLLGYLSDAARTAVQTDRPLLRGLFFDWPGDADAWRYPGQFLCGDDLLVHPVTQQGATTWTTWLPPGDWVDVWTGERLAGGGEVAREVPLDIVPVYCRAQAWPELEPVFRG